MKSLLARVWLTSRALAPRLPCLLAALLLTVLAGCGGGTNGTARTTEEDSSVAPNQAVVERAADQYIERVHRQANEREYGKNRAHLGASPVRRTECFAPRRISQREYVQHFEDHVQMTPDEYFADVVEGLWKLPAPDKPPPDPLYYVGCEAADPEIPGTYVERWGLFVDARGKVYFGRWSPDG